MTQTSGHTFIFEINGVKIYVPEPWIWPDKAVWQKPSGSFIKTIPPVLPDDPPGTVYRADRGITLLLSAHDKRLRFAELWPDFYVYYLRLKPGARGLARLPRKTLDDLPTPIRTRLAPWMRMASVKTARQKVWTSTAPIPTT